jgi:hypothetical protein
MKSLPLLFSALVACLLLASLDEYREVQQARRVMSACLLVLGLIMIVGVY